MKLKLFSIKNSSFWSYKNSVSYMKLQRGVILIVIYIEEIIEAPVKINDAKILICVNLFSKKGAQHSCKGHNGLRHCKAPHSIVRSINASCKLVLTCYTCSDTITSAIVGHSSEWVL